MIEQASGPMEMLDGEYKASDLYKLTGLTYRQLHDWEERAGVMASDREGAVGWRWFTGEHVMALAVCVALRKQFSLPLDNVQQVYRWLLGKWRDAEQESTLRAAQAGVEKMCADSKNLDSVFEADYQSAPARFLKLHLDLEAERPVRLGYLLASLGLAVYLTRQRKFCGLATEGALADFFLKREIQSPLIICPLNAIFNDVLKKAGKPPMELDSITPSLLQYWKTHRPDLTAAERKVIDLIRAGEYQRVTVHVKGGGVIQADVEEELSEQERARTEKAILDAVGRKGYQTVIVTEQSGKVVRLGRKTVHRLTTAAGKT